MNKVLIALFLCFAVAFAVDNSVIQSFIEFQHTYGKFYDTNEEFNFRLAVFNSNVQLAAQLQKSSNATQFGITKFMDLTPSEFKNTILMRVPAPQMVEDHYTPPTENIAAPSSYDWRSRAGIVTPVYNQGQCGSCWAFSATENIESQWALKGHPLTPLSMQQVTSCDKTCGGCNGGYPNRAYEYVMQAGGIDSYASYPYTSRNGQTGACQFKPGSVAAKLSGWNYATRSKSETEMVNYLVAHGPLSICVDAQRWQFYKGGVMTPASCGRSIDHCVVAVGYNTGANPPIWIVRNSWGTDWGIQGYIHLQYGTDTCALAEFVTNSVAQ